MRMEDPLKKIGRYLGIVQAEAEVEREARLAQREQEVERMKTQRQQYVQQQRRIIERRR